MDIKFVTTIKCHVTVFTFVLKCSWEMFAFNVILCVNFLRHSFATERAHEFDRIVTSRNLVNVLVEVS